MIFAISFCAWLSFAAENLKNAHAENSQNSENSAETVQNTETKSAQFSVNATIFPETIRAISGEADGGNAWIEFHMAEFIDTEIDQLNIATVKADFQMDGVTGGSIFGVRTGPYQNALFFGSQVNQVAKWRFDFGGNSNAIGFTTDKNANIAEIGASNDLRNTVNITFSANNLDANLKITSNGTVANYDFTTAAIAETPKSIFLGSINTIEEWWSGGSFAGKIYSFQIEKHDGATRDFIPAAKYSGCGENFALEYGFIDQANSNKFYGNSSEDGILMGSEEIVAPECPEKPESSQNDSQNSDENNENSAQDSENNSANSDNSAKILAPNAGIFAQN